MSFSEEAWQSIDSIYQAIKALDFNQSMINGTLPFETYGFYLEQDNYYLKYHAECDIIISEDIVDEYKEDYIDSTRSTVECIKENEQFFISYNISKSNLYTTAAIGYSGDLLSTCSSKTVEEAVAITLPCIWIYCELGIFMKSNSVENNPYDFYLDYYSNDNCRNSLDRYIAIADDLAANSADVIKKRMLEAFHRSAVWEWHFWDDAYKKKLFNQLT
jgi:thiaminase/transcriptional activator TenA